MTTSVVVTGLFGDRDYLVQVRPVFTDGSAGDWGPTFSIIKRDIPNPPEGINIIQSSVGIKLIWAGSLDAQYGEQWLVKKFDEVPTEQQFDTYGIDVYRGSASSSVEVDLRQETEIHFGVVKIDMFGNRSSVVTASKTFSPPPRTTGLALQTITGGVKIKFNSLPVSEQSGYQIVRAKYEAPFSSFSIVSGEKNGFTVTLGLAFNVPQVGQRIQVDSGNSQYDGTFIVTSSNTSTKKITYNHSVAAPILSSTQSGQVFLVSGGPSDEGVEIYRTETTNSSKVVEFDFYPDPTSIKCYIAVGTEDYYKNLVTWTTTSDSNRASPLSYGRQFISQIDNISITTNDNKFGDDYWKYGYMGWAGVTSPATGELYPISGAQPTIRAGAVTQDDPDSILLGIESGSMTEFGFGTESRLYPSLSEHRSTTDSSSLSKPIINDPFVDLFKSSSNIGQQWTEYYISSPRAQVWAECSGTSILSDSVDTKDPIVLNGSKSIAGSFRALVNSWGDVTDFPEATLKLYIVSGTWASTRSVNPTDQTSMSTYDPHYMPLPSTFRSARDCYVATSRSKSGRVCTLVLPVLADSTLYPNPGDSISVSDGVNDSLFSGNWIVATRSANTITYRVFDSTTTVPASSTRTTVIRNHCENYTPLTKSKVGTICQLNFANGVDVPPDGALLDININDPAFDAVSVTVTRSEGTTNSIIYENKNTNISVPTTSVGTSAYIARPDDGPEVHIDLINSWGISKQSQFFDENGTPSPVDIEWGWIFPESVSATTIRLVWVLEYEKSDFIDAGFAGGTSIRPGTDYTVRLNRFKATPSSKPFANLGSDDNFGGRPIFRSGASFDGDVLIGDDLFVEGTTSLESDLFVNAPSHLEDVDVDGDLNINGILSINGLVPMNSGSFYVYMDDYPITNTGTKPIPANPTTAHEYSINSIRVGDALPTLFDAEFYLTVVTWGGMFFLPDVTEAVNSIFMFRLMKSDGGPNNPSTVAGWDQVKVLTTHAIKGYNFGGTMTHISLDRAVAGTSSGISYPAITLPQYLIRLGTTGTAGTNNHPATVWQNKFDGLNKEQWSFNKMSMLIIPVTHAPTRTVKPSLSAWGGGYVSSVSTTIRGESSTPRNTKSATYVIQRVTDWKQCYNQDGSKNNQTTGLWQGYSDQSGNTRSVWGFGNNTWTKVKGTELPDPSVATIDNLKIVACNLDAEARNWADGGAGTLIIGTHSDNSTEEIGNYTNISGRNIDRKRVSYANEIMKRIDLGTDIGAGIWNGSMKGALGLGSLKPIADKGFVRGLIFGPAPNTSKKYLGSLVPSTLNITVTIQWTETKNDTEPLGVE